jgi:hypothetical protein
MRQPTVRCVSEPGGCRVKNVETPALSPLGERVERRPDALHREAGRVRGSGACARPFAAHNSPVKAFSNGHVMKRI